MSIASKIIVENATADFEPLSDWTIYRGKQPFLGPPQCDYYPKLLCTDQDKTCELSTSTPLCDLFRKGLEANEKIKQNRGELEEIYNNPDVSLQEYEITQLWRDCDVTLRDFDHANRFAKGKFEFIKNMMQFVNTTRRHGYYLTVSSGSFGSVAIQKDFGYEIYPAALRILWKGVGLPENQVIGSYAFFDKYKKFVKARLNLGPRKGANNRQRSFFSLPYEYRVGFTDDITDSWIWRDASTMGCSMDILSIGVIVEEFQAEELPYGIIIPYPRARDDAMERHKLLMKIETGIVKSLSKNRENFEKAKLVAKEAREFAKKCLSNDERFYDYRDLYIERSMDFLDLLVAEFNGKRYNLFPEIPTEIRWRLEILGNEQDIKECKKLIKETCDSMRMYSLEFQALRI